LYPTSINSKKSSRKKKGSKSDEWTISGVSGI
jgi:hypothetical protein